MNIQKQLISNYKHMKGPQTKEGAENTVEQGQMYKYQLGRWSIFVD